MENNQDRENTENIEESTSEVVENNTSENTEDSTTENPEENEAESKKENKDKNLYIIIAILIIIIILLLLRSCRTDLSNNISDSSISKNSISENSISDNDPLDNNFEPVKPEIENPVGNFEITDQAQKKEETQKEEVRTITFAGFGGYNISETAPNIELKNSDKNFVDMVFELTDKETGELIARTGKIPAGKFVYVNVMDFYKEKGTHDVKINISTYDSETGTAMNGMEQEMKLIIH